MLLTVQERPDFELNHKLNSASAKRQHLGPRTLKISFLSDSYKYSLHALRKVLLGFYTHDHQFKYQDR